MSSPLNNVVRTITSQLNSAAFEARLMDDVNLELSRMRKYVKYHVPEESRDLANELGIPFYEGLTQAHPHPLHKIQFRVQHLLSLPSFFTTPTTILQVKKEFFSEIQEATRQPLTINNAIIEAEDLKRFDPTTLNPNSPSTWRPIITPTAFFSDTLHHMTHEQVYSLFINNPLMKIAYFRCVIPPESLVQDFSAMPSLYEYTIKKGVLTYYAERDRARPYKQPASGSLWLTTKRIVPKSLDGPTLHVNLIESNGPWHIISVSYAEFAAQPVRSFRGLDLVTLPQVFRRKVQDARVPRKLLRSMILYGKTVPKHEREDLFAKVRQAGGMLENSAIPLDLLLLLVASVQEILKQENSFNLESKFKRGVLQDLRYYTYGGVKAHTVDRYRRRQIKTYLSSVHDGDGDLDLKTHDRYVRYDGTSLGLQDPPSSDLHWTIFWRRLMSWHHEDNRYAITLRVQTLDAALRDIVLREPRTRVNFSASQLQAQRSRLRTPVVIRTGEVQQRRAALFGLTRPGALELANQAALINRRAERAAQLELEQLERDDARAQYRAALPDNWNMVLRRVPAAAIPLPADVEEEVLRPARRRAQGALYEDEETDDEDEEDEGLPRHDEPDGSDDEDDDDDDHPPPAALAQLAPQVVFREERLDRALPDIQEEEEGTDVVTIDDQLLTEMQFREALLLDHRCDIPDCPSHSGFMPQVCSSGAPSLYTGPCHLCPAYEDGTPAGGASAHARYITTIPAARRNYALAQQKAIPQHLTASEQLNVTFPRTAGKRYHDSFVGKIDKMRLMHFPVTEEDCLLTALRQVNARLTHDDMWEVLHRFSSTLTRQALLRENPLLNVYHLEILALYYQLNIGLVIRDAGFQRWPVDYGVQEGPRTLLLLENQHFSVLEVGAVEERHFRTRAAKPAHANRAEKDLRYLLQDIQRAHAAQDKTARFVPYVASWNRAEALVRCLRDGSEGLIRQRFGEDYVKEMENVAEQRTKNVAREVQLLVDVGEGGNGKSRPIMQALSQKKYHKNHLFQVVLYTNRLQAETSLKLNLRAKCADGKGTPRHFCETWERAITEGNQCCLAVFDEISKFHPGYIDLYIALNPMVTHVILLGDPKQNSHHTPGESPLNNHALHTPEDEYFIHYANEYTVGTMRTPQLLADFMNIPTTSQDVGEVDHAVLIPDGAHPIVPSQKMVMDISAMMAKDADTSASSQGLDWDHVALIINPTVISLPDVHMFWTILGRVKRRLTIVWQCMMDPSTTQRINATPYLRALMEHRYRAPDAGPRLRKVDWYHLMQHKMGSLYSKLRLPNRPWTNLHQVDFSLYPITSGLAAPQGGRAPRFTSFEQLPSMTRVYYEAREAEAVALEREPEESEPLVHATTTHAARSSVNESVELLKSRIREKYDRELEAAGTISQQFPDRTLASRHNPKLTRSPFELKPDGRVDPALISLHHTMKADDKASTAAGIKKRITTATRDENLLEWEAAQVETGPALWNSLCGLMHWDPEEILTGPSDDELQAYQREHEVNRLRVKTLSMLARKESDAEPEKGLYQMDIGFKQELKVKEEKEGSDATASQTLVTTHDHMLMRFGRIGRFLADRILESLPQNIYLHLKRSPGQLHRYIRRHWKKVGKCLINDYTAFDQGQNAQALYLEIRLMKRFGIPASFVNEYFESKVSAYSWLGSLAIMRFTGEFGTFLFNSLFNMAYANLKYDLAGVVCLFGGDDSAYNGIPVQRLDWSHWERLIPLESKEELTDQPTFVSWRITELGIFKNPKILFTRYHIHKALGDLHNVLISYFYEYSFAARMFDDLHQYLDDEQAGYHAIMTSIFFRNKRIPKSKIYLDTDKYLAQEEELYLYLCDKLDRHQDLASDMFQKEVNTMSRAERREFVQIATTAVQGEEEGDDAYATSY